MTALHLRTAAPAALLALSAPWFLAACSGDDDPADGGTSTAAKDGTEAPGRTKEGDLENLGKVLEISLPDVESYDLDGSTLTVTFGSGSKDVAPSHCLVARGGVDGLGHTDVRLRMSYPDGEHECAS